MGKYCASILLIASQLLFTTPAAAQMAHIWVGDETSDPITDKTNAAAMIYDNALEGFLAARCRNGDADLMIKQTEGHFDRGARQDVLIRVDAAAPLTIPAIATEPEVLVLDVSKMPTLFTTIMRAKKVAARFTSEFGRQITMTFEPLLPGNTLHMIGRVVAACGIAPYPQQEVDKAADDFIGAAKSPKKKK